MTRRRRIFMLAAAMTILKIIAEASRWKRGLGSRNVAARYCRVVANPQFPDVWEHNHTGQITAVGEEQVAEVFAVADRELAHSPWRVFHTDCFTPDAFVARLALEGFEERPAVIQMALDGAVTDRGAAVDLRSVETDADWDALLELVVADFSEGKRTPGLDLSRESSASMVAGYRSRLPHCRFHLVVRRGAPVAYGAIAVAPDGVGMIDDLFTLPSFRRQGLATGMIATFVDRLRAAGCDTIFLGALASESAKHLYARLGFRPVMLARTWVRGSS